MASWDEALGVFLEPFVALLGHKKRRQMCPLYVAGLIGPGERKSMQPMAARLDPARYDRFHHFISDGLWDEVPLEAELARTADRLVGAPMPPSSSTTPACPRRAVTPWAWRRNTPPCSASAPTARRWCP